MKTLYDEGMLFYYADACAAEGIEDEYIYETANYELYQDWCDFAEKIKQISGTFLIYGTVVRWDGAHPDAWNDVKGTLYDAVEFLQNDDSDSTHKYYVDGEDLWFECKGHDNPCNPTKMRIRKVDESVDLNRRFNFEEIATPIGNLF